jgi:enterochelin esterase family protein
MVEVPAGAAAAGGPMPWEFRDVPHGALTIETHQSRVLNAAMRQIVVYTPPGYDKDRAARYPVLYLFHGTNDLAVGWTMAGRANLILDHLIAGKQAVPMIVVMPWGHALPFGARPAAGQPSNNDLFERYLLDEVMPLVEAKYRTRARGATGATGDRRARAVAGLSMGGSQAMQIGLGHRALFGSIGVFGAGLPRAEFETRDDASAAAAPNNPIGLFYLGIGKEDGGLARARELSAAITARGFPLTYHEVDGGHTYPTWRTLLVDLAPLLFRAPKGATPGAVKRPAL